MPTQLRCMTQIVIISVFFVPWFVYAQDISIEPGKSTILQISKTLSTVLVFNEDIKEYSGEGVRLQTFDERVVSSEDVAFNTLILDEVKGFATVLVRTRGDRDYHFVLEPVDIPSKIVYINKEQKIGLSEAGRWETSYSYEKVIISAINYLIEGRKKLAGYKADDTKRNISLSFIDSKNKKNNIPATIEMELQGRNISAYKINVNKGKLDFNFGRDMFNMVGVLGVSIIDDIVYLVTKKGVIDG